MISDRNNIPHLKVSPEILMTINFTIYTLMINWVWEIKRSTSENWKKVSSSEFVKSKKKTRSSDDIWHRDEARTWRQSHQAFQGLPENKVTSKTEYTNTQQGWPVLRVYNIPLTRHKRFVKALEFICWKAIKSRSLISSF